MHNGAWLADGAQIDENYYQKEIKVVDQRRALAGLRLAAVLNEASAPVQQGEPHWLRPVEGLQCSDAVLPGKHPDQLRRQSMTTPALHAWNSPRFRIHSSPSRTLGSSPCRFKSCNGFFQSLSHFTTPRKHSGSQHGGPDMPRKFLCTPEPEHFDTQLPG